MTQEREQILQMVARGRLTVEQADQLLEALDSSGRADAEEQNVGRQQRGRPRLAVGAGRSSRTELVGQLAAQGASVAYLKELRDSGLMNDVPPDLLVALTAVRGEQIAHLHELRTLGLLDLPHDLLTSLTALGVKATDIRELRDMGVMEAPREVWLPLMAMDRRPAYVKELLDAGLLELASERAEGEEGAPHGREASRAQETSTWSSAGAWTAQ